MLTKDLSVDIAYVKKHKLELLKEYRDKFILVHEGGIISSFDTYAHAASEGVRLFGMNGDFLVYEVVDKEPLNFIMGAAL